MAPGDDTPPAAPAPDATSNDLGRLIAAEQSNDALLQRAREEAAATIRRAQEHVAERRAALAAEVERAADEAARTLATERDTRIAALEAAARRDVARYREVTEPQIARAAGAVVDQLIRGGSV